MIQVITTSDDRTELESIAKHLVEAGLAACCQIEGPITSVYRWKGNVETSLEFRLIAKSTKEKYVQLESAILNQHHYDQPQIVAIDLVFVDSGYENWAKQCLE